MKLNSIADRLEHAIGIEGRPIRLIDAIEIQLIQHFALPKIQAAEQAERHSPSIAKMVSDRAQHSENLGISPILVMLGSQSEIIAGFCHILSEDAPLTASLKQKRANSVALLNKMRSISFSQFEMFGKKLLEELGAGNTTVTTHSNDQGIDFYGRFNIGQMTGLPLNFFKLAHDVSLLVLGQAKHYPNRALQTAVVRELIGAMSLARTKTFSSDGLDLFKSVDMRPFSPVVALLLTTGTISSGAMYLANASGIIAKNGEQLATFLSDRGIGMIEYEERTIFDPLRFDEWLES